MRRDSVFAIAIIVGFIGVARAVLARGVPIPSAPTGRWATNLGSYPLDSISRELSPGVPLDCNTDNLVVYRGTHLRFARPARVYRELVPKIAWLEQILIDAGNAVYGRPPSRFVHFGAYNCRPIRLDARLLSEHALGNAIDLAGVDFAALPRREILPAHLPAVLRRPFRVRVLDDWQATEDVHALHAQYWERVRATLEAQPQLFRGMLGPRFPGHANHLHFDMAPWDLIWM